MLLALSFSLALAQDPELTTHKGAIKVQCALGMASTPGVFSLPSRPPLMRHDHLYYIAAGGVSC